MMEQRLESSSVGREVSYYASFEIFRGDITEQLARTVRFRRPDEVATTRFERVDAVDPGTVPFVKYSSPYELFDLHELFDPRLAAALMPAISAPRPPSSRPPSTTTRSVDVRSIDVTEPFATIEGVIETSAPAPACRAAGDSFERAFGMLEASGESMDAGHAAGDSFERAFGMLEMIETSEPASGESFECDLGDIGEIAPEDTSELLACDLISIDGTEPLSGDTLVGNAADDGDTWSMMATNSDLARTQDALRLASDASCGDLAFTHDLAYDASTGDLASTHDALARSLVEAPPARNLVAPHRNVGFSARNLIAVDWHSAQAAGPATELVRPRDRDSDRRDAVADRPGRDTDRRARRDTELVGARRTRHATELVGDGKPGVSARFVVIAVTLLATAFALGVGIPFLVAS